MSKTSNMIAAFKANTIGRDVIIRQMNKPAVTNWSREQFALALAEHEGVTTVAVVKPVREAKPRVAGTDQDKRRVPKVLGPDGQPYYLSDEQKAVKADLTARGVKGAAYHEACAKEGIPTTKTRWVKGKVKVA